MIKSIEIEIGGQTLKLTPDEAQELQRELSGLLQKETVKWYPYPSVPTVSPVWPLNPVWYNRTVTVTGTSTQPTFTATSGYVRTEV